MMEDDVITVLIVDDSRLVRQLLKEILSRAADIEVVATAIDPFDAREKIKQYQPDVITLDIEMPRMDGITFLKNLMRLRPLPVVMVSTLTQKSADITLQALELGAVDYVAKPKGALKQKLGALAAEIIVKVRQAAYANIQPPPPETSNSHSPRINKISSRVELLAVGSSTGGTEAIKFLLQGLPQNMPPIVIVQHMPGGFTTSFARRLNQCCHLTIQELGKGKIVLKPNNVYIANGDHHMMVRKRGDSYLAHQSDTQPVNRHKPSVDVLFESVANAAGRKAIGIILTGMGQDGSLGLLKMKQAGAFTIGQDKKSCVVWGMPKAAEDAGATRQVLPLNKISIRVGELCSAG